MDEIELNQPHPHRWTFLTNHGHMILCLTRMPHARLTDLSRLIGITERATQRILSELVEAKYVVKTKHGRRNSYEVNKNLPLRHPLEAHCYVKDFVEPLLQSSDL